MSRRYEPPVERKGYSVGKRIDSMLQHTISDHYQSLAQRGLWGANCVWPFPCRHGNDRLLSQQMGDEGWEE